MKKFLIPLSVLAFAGCCSFTEVATDVNGRQVEDGDVPVGEVCVFNVSYQFLGVLPWSTGTTWQQGPYETDGVESGVTWFEDRASIDEQLRSVKHAMDVFGASKLDNLRTVVNESKFWSLFLFNRRTIKTNALLLK